jgi:hypothetical protein
LYLRTLRGSEMSDGALSGQIRAKITLDLHIMQLNLGSLLYRDVLVATTPGPSLACSISTAAHITQLD